MEKNTPENNKKNFAEWLEFLQQESWQLELIISSILLLVLGSSGNYVEELLKTYGESPLGFFIGLLMPIILFIKTNLVVHIFFRGLWIGCIGLRYVSEDIDFEELSYTKRFNQYLKRKVNSFDNYIEKLERISSIIFSYSFLMIFHFISFWLFVFSLVLFVYFFSEIIHLPQFVLAIFTVIIFFMGILNFIDFLTLGQLKKYKWTTFLFYPFYRVYNLFSLSFLYRPLHYNFIDNPLGRKYMYFMIPYIALLMLFHDGISIGGYNYMPLKQQNSNWAVDNYYDTLRKDKRIRKASIDQFIYSNNHLQLFIKYQDDRDTEKCLAQICPDFVPFQRSKFGLNALNDFQRGFKEGSRKKDTGEERDSMMTEAQNQADASIECIGQLYSIAIDSLSLTNKDFIFYEHPNMGEKGIFTVIDISNLSNGKHSLILEAKTGYKNDEFLTETIKIPFYKKGVSLNSAD